MIPLLGRLLRLCSSALSDTSAHVSLQVVKSLLQTSQNSADYIAGWVRHPRLLRARNTRPTRRTRGICAVRGAETNTARFSTHSVFVREVK